jgi:hypothetical protein
MKSQLRQKSLEYANTVAVSTIDKATAIEDYTAGFEAGFSAAVKNNLDLKTVLLELKELSHQYYEMGSYSKVCEYLEKLGIK